MEHIRCNLCGSSDHRLIYSKPDNLFYENEWFNVVECNSCGLGFVNPRPGFNEVDKYYPSPFYDYFENPAIDNLKRYKQESLFLENLPVKGRLLLDIGCANGDFPRFMKKKGWDVEGVEISKNSKPISDFKVYKEDFSRLSFSEARYDVITAWAVLEHVHDPMAYFIKASQVLKRGGFFIFLVTNFESISSKYLFLEDIPRHLYFFTEKTVKSYLSRSGLKFIKADYSNKVYSMKPVNWLRYYTYRYLLHRGITWEDIPENRIAYFKKNNLKSNIISNLKYIITHAGSLTVIDRLLMPVFEELQIILNKYGIVTYIALKD